MGESEIEKELEELVEKVDCPQVFVCSKTGFKNLCKLNGFTVGGFVECGCNCRSSDCTFGFNFGYSYLCSCPLRVYAATKLKK